MTACIGWRGKGLSLMKKSPVLASVMPPPSWVPVRSDQVATAGSCADDLRRLSEQPVGFLERGTRRSQVIKYETAFVQRRQKARTDLLIAHES